MQIHRPIIRAELGLTHWRFVCSDLHLGSPACDLARLRSDLADARKVGARVLINGDVFDAIGRHDKRSDALSVVKELRSSKDLLRATVEYAARQLAPWADLIDVVGIGNHEETWIKWHEFNPVAELVSQLNTALALQGASHRIEEGGKQGYIQTVFRFPSGGDSNGTVHNLLYFHGCGGDSPVTKGTIDMNRKSVAFDYHAVTFGHKHNRLFMNDVVLGLSSRGHLKEKDRVALQTGSYFRNYDLRWKKDPLDYTYAESSSHAQKPMGGLFLGLTPRRIHTKSPSGTVSQFVIDQAVCTGVPWATTCAAAR